MKDVTLKPRVSEKAYAMSQTGSVYVFVVPTSANKHTVAQAVESQFGVTVEAVNIVVAKGKAISSYRKRSRAIAGRRATTKKAYVTLKKGDSIAIFTSDEADDAKKTKAKAKETK